MPSGFTNTQDQLTPTYYRVYVNMSGFPTTATDNNSGAVEIFDHDYFASLNTTADNSIRRARGNIRWNAVLTELQRFANCEILDATVQKTGPADETEADDVAISLAFTVGYAQEEYVYNGWLNLTGGAVLSDGVTPLDGKNWELLDRNEQSSNVVACISEAVTRGICIGGSDGYTRRYRTIDPVTIEQRDLNVIVQQPDTPANVWGVLTVGLIDTMTQVSF